MAGETDFSPGLAADQSGSTSGTKPVPVTPEIAKLLEAIAGLPALESLSVEQARAQAVQRSAIPMASPPIASAHDFIIAGPGGDLTIRAYAPLGEPPFPILMFFHGSGFVVANLDTHDPLCRHLCAASGALVFSVDYRLAPEHPFPAAVDDCLAATRWAQANGVGIGGDPTRIAVAGDSAGGNLAAVTAMMLRDLGEPLAAQVLLYPVTDYPDRDHPSYTENAVGYGLTTAGLRWYWAHYVGSAELGADWRASPLRAHSLASVAPAFIATAEFDPLRDEGQAFADRLRLAGVEVHYECASGMIHAFASMLGLEPEAEDISRRIGDWLKSRYARPIRQG